MLTRLEVIQCSLHIFSNIASELSTFFFSSDFQRTVMEDIVKKVISRWDADMKIKRKLNSKLKLKSALFQLYRRRFLQLKYRWKALDEIYKFYILLTS